jgi:hypothetical protein
MPFVGIVHKYDYTLGVQRWWLGCKCKEQIAKSGGYIYLGLTTLVAHSPGVMEKALGAITKSCACIICAQARSVGVPRCSLQPASVNCSKCSGLPSLKT